MLPLELLDIEKRKLNILVSVKAATQGPVEKECVKSLLEDRELVPESLQ